MHLEVVRLRRSGESAAAELQTAVARIEDNRPTLGELLVGTLGGTMGLTSAGLILIGGGVSGADAYGESHHYPFGDSVVRDPDNGIAPGTAFEDLPDDWVCPDCGVGKDMFEPAE